MHGSNLAFGNPPASPPLLPAAAFGHYGSLLRKLPDCDLRRSRHLGTAFRSPRAAARFQATSPGSMFPACSFDAPAEPGSSARSVPDSVPRPRFPVAGEFIARNPSPITCPAFQPALPVSLPFGTFRSLGLSARPGSPAGSLPPRNVRNRLLPADDGCPVRASSKSTVRRRPKRTPVAAKRPTPHS